MELTGMCGIMILYIRDISDTLCALEDIRVDASRYGGLRSKSLLFDNPKNNFRAFLSE